MKQNKGKNNKNDKIVPHKDTAYGFFWLGLSAPIPLVHTLNGLDDFVKPAGFSSPFQ